MSNEGKTDKEILGELTRFKETPGKRGGRPKINRELVIRLLKDKTPDGLPRYTMKQISIMARCSTKSVKRIKKEAKEAGLLKEEERKGRGLDIQEADFDSECLRAMGFSFYDWVTNQSKSQGKYIFNFTEKCWRNIWDQCSLVRVADRDDPLGDKICMDWLKAFSDPKRIRGRKKLIRFFFRFLKRRDLNDQYLKMKKSSDPVQKRDVPEVTMMNFPGKLMKCIEEMETIYPGNGEFILTFKIVTQMRTGSRKTEKELFGIRKGSEYPSYIRMNGPEEVRANIYAKGNVNWPINWMPSKVRKILWEKYQQLEEGDFLLKGVFKDTFVKKWGKITQRIIGRKLSLHDLRKVSITWLYVMGVQLDIATMINVGWEDTNTARDHYLNIRQFLRKSTRAEYREQIPDWFKDGLEEFIGDDALLSTGHNFSK